MLQETVAIRDQGCVALQYVKLLIKLIVNESLLPSSFSGVNTLKSSCEILLKRDGTSPNTLYQLMG